jgi:hypothetical protein
MTSHHVGLSSFSECYPFWSNDFCALPGHPRGCRGYKSSVHECHRQLPTRMRAGGLAALVFGGVLLIEKGADAWLAPVSRVLESSAPGLGRTARR